MFQYKLPAPFTHFLRLLPVVEQISEPQGAPLGRTHQKTGPVVEHLQSYASRLTTDHRLALPQGLGYRQAEALAQGLLEDYIRSALEGVDFTVCIRGKRQYMKVLI